MARTVLNPDTVAPPCNPTYSMAALAETSRLLFIAGQVAVDRSGETVGSDIETQTRQVFENLRLILQAAGATLDLGVRREYFSENPPPSTLVEVSALVDPDYLIELKAVAELRD